MRALAAAACFSLVGALLLPATVQAQDGICGRTSEVITQIVRQISGVSDCANVTATHLAAITDLSTLRSKNISALAAGDFDGLTALTTLRLDGNALTELPDDVFDGLTSLNQLRLDGNALTELPADVFDGLTALDQLRLYDNALTELPADVFDGLTSLGSLYLRENSLATLPDGVFDELTALTFLSLGDNSLTELPDGVFDNLTALEGLDLYTNSLTGLRAGVFDNLTALEVLNLHTNALTELRAGVFDNLTALEGLSLDNNQLTELPDGVFDNNTALYDLYLYENPLTELRAGVFDNLTALVLLELRDNQLTELPDGVFDELTALRALYLGGNSLTGLRADVFDGLTALDRLELHNNQLQSLPDGLFSGLASLTYFYLEDNLTNPMELTVTVEKVGTDQVRAKVLAGAPFAVDIPVTLVDGTLAAGATMLRVAAGAVEGTAVTVTRTAGTTEAVTVDVDLTNQPPLLPSDHRGYAFATGGGSEATTGLPATILPSAGDVTSSDATLSGLTVTGGGSDLVTFVSGTTTYTAMVASTVAEVTVTAMTTNSGASIEYLDGDDATLDDAGAADGHQVAVAEGDNVIKVKVTAADGNTTQTYTVTVTRAADTDNNAPSFTSSATFNPAENQTAVGTVEASDSDTGDDITGYALTGGADQALFSIGSTSGVLTFQAAPNYEDAQDANTDNAYLVEVQATSGTGDREQTATQTITVTVQDANEQPDKPAKPTLAAVSGSATSLTATWEKPDLNGGPDITGYNVNYRVSTATAWETFTHSGTGVTRTITGLTASTSYQVRVQALNGETPSAFSDPSDAVTTILDDDLGICTLNPGDLWCGVVTVGTYGPIGYGFVDASTDTGALSDKGFSVETNSYTIDEVWVRSRPNVGDLFFSLTSALTAADQAKLVLHVDDNSGSFAFSTATGPTSPQTYIWESSGLDWSSTSSVTLRLRDTTAPTNSVPTFSLATAARSVAENTGAGQNVGAVLTATDANPGDTLTYSLEETGDHESFDIVSTSGQIQTKSGVTYNYEAKSTYTVVVKADDGNGGSATIDVTIKITDVNEAPVAPAAPSVSSTSGSTTSLDVMWTEPDNTGRPGITSYDLQYQKTTESTWTDGPQGETGTSASIGSLEEDTKYRVQVRATNDEGDSLWSLSGTGRPMQPTNSDPTFTERHQHVAGLQRDYRRRGGFDGVGHRHGGSKRLTRTPATRLSTACEGTDAGKFGIIMASGQILTKVGDEDDQCAHQQRSDLYGRHQHVAGLQRDYRRRGGFDGVGHRHGGRSD